MTGAKRTVIITKSSVFKRDYRLIENDTEIGTIIFARGFKSVAETKVENQEWEITATGFWKRLINYKGSHRPYRKGNLSPKWSGKIIFEASDGKIYTLKKPAWYKSKSGWYDANDKPVVELNPSFSFSNKQGTIEIFQPSHPDLWLMVTVAWFNYIIQKKQAAAAA